jgi:hypothetical protein
LLRAPRNVGQRGNRLPLGDQESTSRDAERGVMMEAAPTSSLEMPKPDLLLELLIITLDAPAHFSKIDQTGEADVLRQRRKPILRRLVLGVAPAWPDTRLPGLSTNELPGGNHSEP